MHRSERSARAAILFDHLIGAAEQRRRDREAERLSSLEVNDKFVPGWLLHRKVGWLGAKSVA
jgi:hypothetical protein